MQWERIYHRPVVKITANADKREELSASAEARKRKQKIRNTSGWLFLLSLNLVFHLGYSFCLQSVQISQFLFRGCLKSTCSLLIVKISIWSIKPVTWNLLTCTLFIAPFYSNFAIAMYFLLQFKITKIISKMHRYSKLFLERGALIFDWRSKKGYY